MTKTPRIAAVAAVGLALSITLVAVYLRHPSQPTNAARSLAGATMPEDGAIERAIRAGKVTIGNLSVRSAGEIVILRGSGDTENAQRAVEIVKSLGVARVANLIQNETIDDEAIRRFAERELARTGALDGCLLRVECQNGVLSVTGTVQRELQRDAARMALRNVRGAREVRVDLSM